MLRAVLMVSIISAALICPLSAQRGGGGGGRGGGSGMPGGGAPGMGMANRVNKAEQVAKELKIEKQMGDVENIFNDAQKKYSALLTSPAGQALQQMLNAELKGADTSALTKQVTDLESQLVGIEAEALAKVMTLADAKQKNKAAKVFGLMAGMFDKGDWKNRP